MVGARDPVAAAIVRSGFGPPAAIRFDEKLRARLERLAILPALVIDRRDRLVKIAVDPQMLPFGEGGEVGGQACEIAVVALTMVLWGLALGAAQLLPRIGYANPVAGRATSWSCSD